MQSLQKEVPGAPDTSSDLTDLLPEGSTASPPSAHGNLHPLLWRSWIHSSKSWGGRKSTLSQGMLRYQIQEDRGRTHYLFMTVHCCPKSNNGNQLHSLLKVLPAFLPSSPGKGCWDKSTLTGLCDHNRHTTIYIKCMFQCNTETNTNLFFLERSIQVPYFRHLKQGRSYNPQKVFLWKRSKEQAAPSVSWKHTSAILNEDCSLWEAPCILKL